MRRLVAGAAVCALFASSSARANGLELSPDADLRRLPQGIAPPKLDGRLNDTAWEHATRLGDLVQQIPVEGAKPSQETDARVLYDRNFFYVGVRAYDTEPEKIIATVMRRDQVQRSDDRIVIVIDTFHDHQNAFLFSTNANGARSDGIVENNTTYRQEWDGIWYAKSRRDERGWSCEFAIPLKTLSFDPTKSTWGFNLMRTVRRLNEENRWASWKQNKAVIDVSEAGTLHGLRRLEQGVGLDVVPSGIVRWTDERREDRSYASLDPSLDVFYKLGPSVTSALTINTDFSDAEVDARQLNLDRFALFFPETRDFFLQDAGIFDFGGLGNPKVDDTRSPNGMPFFSRSIGIGPDGEVLPIRAGAKATGRVGPLNFGVLDAQVGGHGGLDAKNLSVARGKWNVGEESFVGLIATHGDAATNGSNSLGGADFRFRSSEVFGDQVLDFSGFAQRSHTPGTGGDDGAYGLRLEYPNDLWYWRFSATRIEENFNPALGFVNRDDIHDYWGTFFKRWRPEQSPIRTVDIGVDGRLVTSTHGELETLIVTPTLIDLRDQLDDYVILRAEARTERLDEGFRIAPDVRVRRGRYDWGRGEIEIGTAISRPVSLIQVFSAGGFFSGHLRSSETTLELRPSKHFYTQLVYIQNEGRLSEGNFTDRLLQWRVNLVFTPDLSWDTFIQWDHDSRDLGWNSRVRWIRNPGEELLFVWNQGVDTTDHDFRGYYSEWTGKVMWTFRF
jgi:hypothetical protein